MAIRKEILDELLKDYQKPEDLLGQSGLLQQLSKALIERVLEVKALASCGRQAQLAILRWSISARMIARNEDGRLPCNRSNYREKHKTSLCAACAYIPHIEYMGGLAQGQAKRTAI
jgi:hypothetical protein